MENQIYLHNFRYNVNENMGCHSHIQKILKGGWDEVASANFEYLCKFNSKNRPKFITHNMEKG